MKIKHILNARQFLRPKLIEEIFRLADDCRESDNLNDCLKDRILASLFYEPSTRTRFSFESAMLRLGGSCIATENAREFSSAKKGETLEDTIKIVSKYADIIVLRHDQKGASLRASRVSSVPIINAGDGAGEHPTQALLDLYTINKELGKIDKLNIALVGDLLYGRTIHSLIYLLTNYREIKLFLVSPKPLKLPKFYLNLLKKKKVKFIETDNLAVILSKIDVLYMTRIQKERFASLDLYEKVKNSFILDKKMLRKLSKTAIIMHPLPKLAEIAKEVDADPRAAYFRQAQNGLYIRMALLRFLL
jgi:aspartate carbamoyltransferase catalytic subunit